MCLGLKDGLYNKFIIYYHVSIPIVSIEKMTILL